MSSSGAVKWSLYNHYGPDLVSHYTNCSNKYFWKLIFNYEKGHSFLVEKVKIDASNKWNWPELLNAAATPSGSNEDVIFE